MPPAEKKTPARFTPYQTFVIASLAFLQFAVMLDFMIVTPLGALVMPALGMSPRDFGLIVSAYAFSAGASADLHAPATGIAGDRDRRQRRAVRGHLFADHPVSGDVVVGARDDQAWFLQRAG